MVSDLLQWRKQTERPLAHRTERMEGWRDVGGEWRERMKGGEKRGRMTSAIDQLKLSGPRTRAGPGDLFIFGEGRVGEVHE